MEQQIFKVDNQYLAYAIHYITNEVFNKKELIVKVKQFIHL